MSYPRILTALTVALAACCTTAHAAPAVNGEIDFKQLVEADTIHFRDSMTVFNKEDFEEEIPDDIFDITFIIPRSNEPATQSIKEKIRQLMGCKEKDDYMKMAAEACRKYFALRKKELKEDGENINIAPWGYYATYKFKAMSPKYFTMSYYGDDYRGGAHGSPFFAGFTVLRDNGKVLTWKDFSDKPNTLLPFIEEGFEKYKDVYMEYLNAENTKLPLPTLDPWIEGKAVIFQYKTYEIGPYAIGGPRSRVFVEDYEQRVPDLMKPLILDLVKSHDSSYDFASDEENDDFDDREESTEDTDDEEAPYSLIHNDFKGNFKVEGKPCIESFMKAIPTLYSEANGWFVDPEINNTNGFFHNKEEGDGHFETYGACWNRKDGKKLVILSYDIVNFNTHKGRTENFRIEGDSKVYYAGAYLLGEPADGSFLDAETGFVAFLYNEKTKQLEYLEEPPFNGWGINETNRMLILPKKGKDIKVRDGVAVGEKEDYTYHTLKWNGMTFDYKD